MDSLSLIAVISIVVAGLAMALGVFGPAFAQGRAIDSALKAIAQQPDATSAVARTLFVGLAMIESLAIYVLVVAMILIFANPFWSHFVSK